MQSAFKNRYIVNSEVQKQISKMLVSKKIYKSKFINQMLTELTNSFTLLPRPHFIEFINSLFSAHCFSNWPLIPKKRVVNR